MQLMSIRDCSVQSCANISRQQGNTGAAATNLMATKGILKKSGKYWIWAILSVPGIHILVRYLSDSISYGQVIHETGDWSVGFLALALAVTPLRRLLPEARWPRWIAAHRRALGVASFAYAAFHTLTYLQRKWGYGYILKEGVEPDLLTGWIAFVIFLALAITSNDKSVENAAQKLAAPASNSLCRRWPGLRALDSDSVRSPDGLHQSAALCVVESLRFIRRRRSVD